MSVALSEPTCSEEERFRYLYGKPSYSRIAGLPEPLIHIPPCKTLPLNRSENDALLVSTAHAY